MSQFGWAWIGFALVLAAHVADEAVHDFLSVYNPTVLAIRRRLPFLPVPTFTFARWIGGLIAGIILLFALSPLAFSGNTTLKTIAIVLAALTGVGNGLLHIAGSLWFRKAMPGLISSPVLILAGLWLIASAL
jgi:hypothetical protein